MNRMTFLVAAACLPVCYAITTDEVLAKARKALGDPAAVKSLSIAGVRRTSIETPNGPETINRASELHYLLPGKFLRAESMELPGGLPGPTLVDALNGDSSWNDTQNVPTGANIIIRRRGPEGAPETGPEADAARTRSLRAIYLRNVLLYTLTPPAGSGVTFDYVGEAESPDGKLWMIDAAGPERFALRLFIDQKTNLPVMATWRGFQAAPVIRRMTMAAGHAPPDPAKDLERPKPREVEFELRLTDHEKTGGLLLPRTAILAAEGKTVEEFEIKSAKVNPNLKPEKFVK